MLRVSLWCMHCGQQFPNSSPIEKFGENMLVVECANCHCSTPFKAEKQA
jgi:transcription elongation factor Elf1